jgi:hypothetical protein
LNSRGRSLERGVPFSELSLGGPTTRRRPERVERHTGGDDATEATATALTRIDELSEPTERFWKRQICDVILPSDTRCETTYRALQEFVSDFGREDEVRLLARNEKSADIKLLFERGGWLGPLEEQFGEVGWKRLRDGDDPALLAGVVFDFLGESLSRVVLSD